tara:strand:- start:276 stop:845 length:570 start_codon:yes stop_codon:yes gene_type:complete
MLRIRILLLIIMCSSCSKEIDDLGFRVYTIPAGAHRSGNFYNTPNDSKIKFDFMLNESAEYVSEVSRNQSDINKIYGFSDFGKSHLKYSIRLGWRYSTLTNNLELCWLRHEDGVHKGATIRTIEPNEIYNATIDIQTFWYVIIIDEDTTNIIRRPKGNWGLIRRYMLYPYFGGNEYAPHDITIRIKDTY